MNISKEQAQVAVAAGLALTSPDSDLLEVFRKHGGGIIILHQLLLAIGNGQVHLSSGEPEKPSKNPSAKPSAKPPAKKRTERKKARSKRK